MRKLCSIFIVMSFAGMANSQVTRDQALEAAVVLGINAESLACSDIRGSEVAVLLQRLTSDFGSFEAFRSASAAAGSAHAAMLDARAAARLDSHDPQATQSLSDAERRLADARAEAERMRVACLLSLTESLAQSPEMVLSVIQCPTSSVLPPAYRLVDLDEAGKRTLAWALRMREQGSGATLPTEAIQAISYGESVVAVQAAILRKNQFADPNQAAIDAWRASGE